MNAKSDIMLAAKHREYTFQAERKWNIPVIVR